VNAIIPNQKQNCQEILSKENLLFSIQNDIRGEHLLRAFPANTLIAFQRLHSLAFGCGTFAFAKDRASLPSRRFAKRIPGQLQNIFGFCRIKFFIFLYMLNAVCYIFIESNTWKERMSGLFRFGVSLDKALLDKFDRYIKERNYSNRSEAFRDLIRQELIKKEWLEGDDVAGAITLIYDHHRRDLLNKITDLQHDFQKVIISTQHIHLDHDNCLEIVAVRGQPREVSKLADMMKSIKGVKHCTLSMSSTGEHIE
jgi:CopG family nickel-responsive transcriptional regulator